VEGFCLYAKNKLIVFVLSLYLFVNADQTLNNCQYVESVPYNFKIKDIKIGGAIKSITSPFKAAQKSFTGTFNKVLFRTGPMGAWNLITEVEVIEKTNNEKPKSKDEMLFVDSLRFANGLKLGLTPSQVAACLGNPSEIIDSSAKTISSQILTPAEIKSYAKEELVYLYSAWQEGNIGQKQRVVLNCQEGSFVETKAWQIVFKRNKVVRAIYSDVYSDVDCQKGLEQNISK